MSKTQKPLGIVLWEGFSPIDGAPLVCIATTRKNKNPKTGPEMVQTWIMRSDIPPHVAAATGADMSCCGNCPMRPFLAGYATTAMKVNRRCYVPTRNAPRAVFVAFKEGRYARRDTASHGLGVGEAWALLMAEIRTRPVRAGSYGDPAMVPPSVWASMPVATGYTHQWRQPWALAHKAWCMASVDGPGDVADAHARGWRTFEVVPLGGAPTDGHAAIQCPATTAAKTTCQECRLCGGDQRPGAKSIWLYDHGPNTRGKRPTNTPAPAGRRGLEVFQ